MGKFDRTISLLGEDDFNKLSNKSVLVVGLGGVGGTCLEAIARLGIRNIGIVDNDVIDETNLNRQIISNINNIGLYKVDCFKERILSINPECNIYCYKIFLDQSNINEVFINHYDYVIDCIDSIESKISLYKYCLNNNIKIISSMGTANKLDPSKLVITTLDKTSDDKLAKKTRELARKNNIDLNKINIVYSKESKYKDISKPLPSYMLVSSTAGLYCVYYIVNDLLNESK